MALFRQRMAQMSPVEAPVHCMSWGMVTVMLKSWALACDRPFAPGMLFVTFRVWLMMPPLDVMSMSQMYGQAPSALTWLRVTVTSLPASTCVTWLAARAFSVFAPMSTLPASSVRPHLLPMLASISASRDDGGVDLAWVDGSAVACDGVVDLEADAEWGSR